MRVVVRVLGRLGLVPAVEALAGLLAELAVLDHLAHQGGGLEGGVAELLGEVLADGQADVEAERAFLRSQLLTGTDEEQLLLARQRLLELSGDRDVSALERVRAEFEDARAKQYPYLAPPIFMLLDVAPD